MRYVFEGKPNATINTQDIKLLSIFPNPAENQLNFNDGFPNNSARHIQIVNMNGIAVIERTISENSINIEKLPPGVYDCTVTQDKNVVRSKFVKGKM